MTLVETSLKYLESTFPSNEFKIEKLDNEKDLFFFIINNKIIVQDYPIYSDWFYTEDNKPTVWNRLHMTVLNYLKII